MRNQVLPGKESYAKDAIKFYYKLAKINGLVDQLLNAAGLKNEDSLRWSYNNGRISIEQINAYKFVLGAEEKYLIGKEELTEETKSKEMERLISHKRLKEYKTDNKQEKEEIFTVSHMINFYKNKILKSESSNGRNEVKQELAVFKKEINESIDQLMNLIEAINTIENTSSARQREQ